MVIYSSLMGEENETQAEHGEGAQGTHEKRPD